MEDKSCYFQSWDWNIMIHSIFLNEFFQNFKPCLHLLVFPGIHGSSGQFQDDHQ